MGADWPRWLRGPTTVRAALREGGFALLEGERITLSADWGEIAEVTAFKFDRLTTDDLCLRVELRSGEAGVVTEDDAGFAELDAGLAAHLPGYLAGWRERVIHPAFAPNVTTLWERDGAPDA